MFETNATVINSRKQQYGSACIIIKSIYLLRAYNIRDWDTYRVSDLLIDRSKLHGKKITYPIDDNLEKIICISMWTIQKQIE